MLDASTFAIRLGLTEADLEEKVRLSEVLALDSPELGVRFPAWQLDQSGNVPVSINALLTILSEPWAVYRFLIQHHPELDGRTGLDAIMRGHVREAVETARGITLGTFT
jgi:hypothetical protein